MTADLFVRMDDLTVEYDGFQPPPVVLGLAYYGMTSLVSAPPKIGKSTLLASFATARQDGAMWLGRNVAQGPTLLLTEEGGRPTVHRWHRAPELSVVLYHVAQEIWRDERKESVTAGMPRELVDGWAFPEWTLRKVRSWLEDQRHAVVIVDTLAVWGGAEDENDATAATAAIIRWVNLARDTGACVILVHHARKSGGQYGESVRGSGAILATVDVSWEMTRVREGSDERRMDVRGRIDFDERIDLDFDRDTGEYKVGESADSGDIEEWLAIAPPDGEGRTMGDLVGLWECARSTALRRVEKLSNLGRLRREQGRIGRQMGWRYWAIPPVAVQSSSARTSGQGQDLDAEAVA